MPSKVEIPQEVLLAAAASRAMKDRAEKEDEGAQVALDTKKTAAAALAASVTSGDGDSGLQKEVLMALLESLKEDADERRKKRDADADARNRLMLAQAQNVKLERERLQKAQAYCNHMKENGRGPRIGGQRLSNGTIQYLCLYCHKEFTHETLPPHLNISLEHVGG
jgi:hypothetical protein